MEATSNDDPFGWDVDGVVRELCALNRPWLPSVPSKRPDPVSLSKALRDHEVDGETLLTYEDVFKSTDGLLHDLGLTKMVHKMTFLKAVQYLKSKSPQYHRWKAQYLEEPDFELADMSHTLLDHDKTSTEKEDKPDDPGKPLLVAQEQVPPELIIPESTVEDSQLLVQSLQPTSDPKPVDNAHSSEAAGEPPQKKRKIAPVLISVDVSSRSRRPIPTAADGITLPPSLETGSLGWEEESPDAYLGRGTMRLTDMAPRSSLSAHMSKSIPESQRNFSWQQTKRIPPGRRLQAKRAMQRLMRANNVALSLMMNGTAPFVDELRSQDSEEGDVILPAFGDSGDEEDYDSETMHEIEEEEKERELMKASKTTNLSSEEVVSILEDATARIVANWIESKLPRHLRKAYKLWHDARRRGRNEEILRAMKRVEELNTRIGTLRARILQENWPKEDQVRSQARCLEGSVEDRQYQSWLVEVLTNREPLKPQSILRRRSAKVSRTEPLSDEDGEVITSESDYGGLSDGEFVVDDYSVAGAAGDVVDLTGELDTHDATDLTGDVQVIHTPKPKVRLLGYPRRTEASPELKKEFAVGYAKKKPLVDPTDPREVISLITPEKAQSSQPAEDDPEDLRLSAEDLSIPFDQPHRIGVIPPKLWEANADKWRMLICVLWNLKKPRRDAFFDLVQTMTPDELWSEFIGRAIENRGNLRVIGAPSSPTRGNVGMQIVFTRLFWQFCHTKLGQALQFKSLNDRTIQQLLDNRQEFQLFCKFLKADVICHFPDTTAPSTGRSHSRTLGSGGGDDEDFGSPSKKRKRPIILDQAAKDLRESDRRRVEEQDERRTILRRKLAASTTVSRDKSRLIINESKEDDQGLIYVNEEIATRIKDHQIEGVRFMWNQIVVDSAVRQGCLLAHTMGLGKTMQIITLLVAIAEAAASSDLSIRSQIPKDLRQSKSLVLCPSGLVDNWIDELLLWAPKGILGDFFKIEAVTPRDQRVYDIQDWDANGGILVLGYDMFKRLLEIEAIESILTDSPNIVIADEAHKMKNPNTKLHQASSRFRTHSRIALTGSPLANNVEEYHSMIDWVAPNYLGPLKEFREIYAEPIQVGLWGDSTDYEFRKAKKMLKALEETVAPKAHRATIKSCLKDDLPPKMEFVLTVPLTDLQRQLYEMYIKSAREECAKEDVVQSKVFAVLGVLGLICNHPRCFQEKLTDEKDKVKKDETQSVSLPRPLVSAGLKLMRRHKDLDDPSLSWKIQLLVGILDESRKLNDKVLVFTQSIPTLDYLEMLLRRQQRRVSRLDGSTPIPARQGLTKDFNTGTQEVYLISTNAGGVGLNIYGANRVIIFDFKYNPINEQQAVGRAYRIGQTKPVYVYRFVSGGTFEQILQNKAVFKMQLASRVVDKENPRRWSNKKLGEFLTLPKDPNQSELGSFKGKDVVLDSLLSSQTLGKGIRSIVMTDTFEEEDPNDHVLTAEDRKEVADMIAMNRLRLINPEEYHRMEQELLARLRRNQLPPQTLQTFNGASDSFGKVLQQVPSTASSSNSYTLYTSRPGPVVAPAGQQPLSERVQVAPSLNNAPLENGGAEHRLNPVAGANTYFADQLQLGMANARPNDQALSPSVGTQKVANWQPHTARGAADSTRKGFEDKLLAYLRTPDLQQWTSVKDDYLQLAKSIVTSIQHVRDGKSFGFLPDTVHWKTLNRCIESTRFAAAVMCGHLTPVSLALTSEQGLEQRVEELSRLSDAEFRERLEKGSSRPKDPNHLQNVLRRSNSRIETNRGQSPRAKEDLKVMREVADRRKHRPPRLPSWAKQAIVGEGQVGEARQQSRDRS